MTNRPLWARSKSCLSSWYIFNEKHGKHWNEGEGVGRRLGQILLYSPHNATKDNIDYRSDNRAVTSPAPKIRKLQRTGRSQKKIWVKKSIPERYAAPVKILITLDSQKSTFEKSTVAGRLAQGRESPQLFSSKKIHLFSFKCATQIQNRISEQKTASLSNHYPPPHARLSVTGFIL